MTTTLSLLWAIRDLDDERLGPTHGAVLYALASFYSGREAPNCVRASVEQLAGAAKMARTTALRALADLGRFGIVRRGPRNRREVAEYDLSPVLEAHGRKSAGATPEKSVSRTTEKSVPRTTEKSAGATTERSVPRTTEKSVSDLREVRLSASSGPPDGLLSGPPDGPSEDLSEDLSEDPTEDRRASARAGGAGAEDRSVGHEPSSPTPTSEPERSNGPIITLGPRTERAVEIYEAAVAGALGSPFGLPHERWTRSLVAQAANTHCRGDGTLLGCLAALRTAVTRWVTEEQERAHYTRGWDPRKFLEWCNSGALRQATGETGITAPSRREAPAALPAEEPGEPMSPEEYADFMRSLSFGESRSGLPSVGEEAFEGARRAEGSK